MEFSFANCSGTSMQKSGNSQLKVDERPKGKKREINHKESFSGNG